MKKLLILFILFWSTPTLAQSVQCPDRPNGDTTNACANTRFVQNNGGGGGGGTPGGTSGQVQYNNAGSFGGFTLSGDCTIPTIAAGAITCTKLNNVSPGTIWTQNSNNVNLTGGAITGMPTPTNATDVAIKSYVDALAGGFHVIPGLPSARLATAAVLPNTPTYANGASGVGATLTAGANSTITVDGSVAALNDVILVNTQASALQNGIYTVTTAGDGSTPWVLTRSTSFDQPAEMTVGSIIAITAGATNINKTFALAATVTTVGTTAVNFNLYITATSQWVTTGSDIYYNTGKVGVNNSSPSSKFDVGGAIRSTALTDFAATGSGASLGYNGTSSILISYNSTGSAYLPMLVDGLTLALNSGSGGKVGVANAAPSSQLDVVGAIRSTSLTNFATTGSGLSIGYGSGAGAILAYNSSGAAYLPLNIDGSVLNLNSGSGGKTTFVGGGFEGVNTNPTFGANNPAFAPPGGNNVRTSMGVNTIYNASASTTYDGNLGYSGIFSTTVTADAVLAASAGGLQANLYSNKAGWTEQAALLTTYGSDSGVTGGGAASIWSLMRQGVGTADGNNYSHGIRLSSETDGNIHPGVGATVTSSANNNAYRIGFQATAVTTYGFLVGSDGVNTAGTGDPSTPYAYVSRATGTPLFFVDNGGAAHATAFPIISDLRTKDNIENIGDNAIDLITRLKPITYNSKFTPTIRSAHFGAQDVEPVIPEAVRYTNDYYAVDDAAILAYQVAAFQELKRRHDKLESCMSGWKCRIFGWN